MAELTKAERVEAFIKLLELGASILDIYIDNDDHSNHLLLRDSHHTLLATDVDWTFIKRVHSYNFEFASDINDDQPKSNQPSTTGIPCDGRLKDGSDCPNLARTRVRFISLTLRVVTGPAMMNYCAEHMIDFNERRGDGLVSLINEEDIAYNAHS